MKNAQSLLTFIDSCPTPYHVVNQLVNELVQQGSTELIENKEWVLKNNQSYFVRRGNGSIISIKTAKEKNIGFKIIGAHTDSPGLKIKANPLSDRFDYQLLNVEIYGSVLLNSWFDKDLKIAGRVFLEKDNGELVETLIQLPYKVRIPRLAIHLDRGVNENGFKVNAQNHLLPIIGMGKGTDFDSLIQKELKTKETVLSWDLFLFDAEASSFGGIKNEFIYAPRLDNLASVHAAQEALSKSSYHSNQHLITAYFNHEEVGSTSSNGANSNFLENTLKRIQLAFDLSESDYLQALANSFFISADMAHALHPNFSDKHDQQHAPIINQGPVIKSNANVRYATDGLSMAKFIQWCKIAKVIPQNFHSRNDLGCGSTIGPMVSANLGMQSIDIGNPMLSMHSIREMAGSQDHSQLIKVFEAFFK